MAGQADVLAELIEALSVEGFETGLNAVNKAGLHCGVGLVPGNDSGAHAEGVEGVQVEVSTGGAELVALAVIKAGDGGLGDHVAEVVPGPAESVHIQGILELLVELCADFAEDDLACGLIAVIQERHCGQCESGDCGRELGAVGKAHIEGAHLDGVLSVGLVVEGSGGVDVDGDLAAGLLVDHGRPLGQCLVDGLVNSIVVGELQGHFGVFDCCGVSCSVGCGFCCGSFGCCGSSALAAGAQCKAHNECKHQSDEFLHFGVPPKFFYDHRASAPGFRICPSITSEREAR